jgi:glycosyltransferase involved in cell wall biosynthesis
MSKQKPKSILLYPSDKNGCGYYRTLFPFRYLESVRPEYQITNFYAFNFDLNYMKNATWIRFQRQVTDSQTQLIKQFKAQITKFKFNTKIAYELDDLVHGIKPNNILAYQFYTNCRKGNLIDIFRTADVVTFSTQFLKNYYEEHYNIGHSVVIPNYLPKYLWGSCGQRNKYNKGKKLRILWAGSASHLGKGGDLEFIEPLMKKTKNEFEWVFFGCKPHGFGNEFEFHNWSNIYDYPRALDAIDADIAIAPILDDEFNYGKSDLKILEYSALGLPTIASSIGEGSGPYDMIEGLCTRENKADVWYQTLKDLRKNPEKMMEHLEAGRAELDNRWLEDNIDKYTKVYS